MARLRLKDKEPTKRHHSEWGLSDPTHYKGWVISVVDSASQDVSLAYSTVG